MFEFETQSKIYYALQAPTVLFTRKRVNIIVGVCMTDTRFMKECTLKSPHLNESSTTCVTAVRLLS